MNLLEKIGRPECSFGSLGGFLGKNVEQEFGTFSKGEANSGTFVEQVCLAKRQRLVDHNSGYHCRVQKGP